MLKQLLTGGSVLALLLAGSFSTQAKPPEPMLRSQVQAPSSGPTSPQQQDSSTTTPGQNSTDETSPLGGSTPGSLGPDSGNAPSDTETTPAPTQIPDGSIPGSGPTSPQQQDSSTTTPGQNSTDETSPLGGSTPGGTEATPAPDGATTTPESDASTTSPGSSGSNTAVCSSFPVGSPTGGGTRQRLQAGQQCDFTYPRNF
ncbi:hypothetical protein [Chroococcidiopsis sp. CCMEE 29]|jgi:hypothetical protein|uniref:hypothetical protein n=1 Tax=Chroococcidiopsis sp. CCMEE 29 TaxID=155894 RepID=UPI0020213B59|nr:hypothetical protein [Chroococcidiopsis sp. CCMEE 29]